MGAARYQSVIKSYLPFNMLKTGQLRSLAKALHLSLRELKLVEPELYPDTASDNTVLFYSLYFKKDAPKNILRKIPDIDFDNSVVLSLSEVNGDEGRTKSRFAHWYSNLKL